MTIRCDRIWRNARLATQQDGVGAVDHGLVACAGGRILYAGPADSAPSALQADSVVDCQGRWITPGLIDCHTHLVYAGNRADEFERRLQGASYEEIARQGGGILSTMAATRAASEAELVAAALPRLDALLAEGVTCVEIKSGYGLTLADEMKQLRAIRALAGHRWVGVAATLLAAHAVPPEFRGDAEGYLDLICHHMIPAVAAERLAEAVDGFCERIAFTPAQIDRLFTAARAHGLKVKLHAEQLSNSHGAALAAAHGALSADHLEYLDEDGVAAMARSGTVAVLLPGAFYFTGETKLPPIDRLRAAGVGLAIATDCNPGSAPLTSPLLAMNMAATLFHLTVAECLAGVTNLAARAIGRGDEIGRLAAGLSCDLAIWDIERPADLVYRMGFNPLHARIWRGQDA